MTLPYDLLRTRTVHVTDATISPEVLRILRRNPAIFIRKKSNSPLSKIDAFLRSLQFAYIFMLLPVYYIILLHPPRRKVGGGRWWVDPPGKGKKDELEQGINSASGCERSGGVIYIYTTQHFEQPAPLTENR